MRGLQNREREQFCSEPRRSLRRQFLAETNVAHHHIFSQVYFLYKQEDHLAAKRQLLEKYDVSKSDIDTTWNCNSTCINMLPRDILPFVTGALKEFGDELGKSAKVFIDAAWINFYREGAFQELHNHVGHGCQLALVYFLNYNQQEDGRFYFYDTNTEIVSSDLATLFNGPVGSFGSIVYPNVAEGDILIFPSYLHHGVSPHNAAQVRATVSCNLSFKLK